MISIDSKRIKAAIERKSAEFGAGEAAFGVTAGAEWMLEVLDVLENIEICRGTPHEIYAEKHLKKVLGESEG